MQDLENQETAESQWSPELAHIGEMARRMDYQSGSLIRYARKLASMAARSNDLDDVRALATAAVLTSAAATEATLAEFVYITALAAFTRDFRRAGVAEKYDFVKKIKAGGPPSQSGRPNKPLGPTVLDTDHPEVSELAGYRIAIAHSEPDNPRSWRFGERINCEGASWAARVAEAFAGTIW